MRLFYRRNYNENPVRVQLPFPVEDALAGTLLIHTNVATEESLVLNPANTLIGWISRGYRRRTRTHVDNFILDLHLNKNVVNPRVVGAYRKFRLEKQLGEQITYEELITGFTYVLEGAIQQAEARIVTFQRILLTINTL